MSIYKGFTVANNGRPARTLLKRCQGQILLKIVPASHVVCLQDQMIWQANLGVDNGLTCLDHHLNVGTGVRCSLVLESSNQVTNLRQAVSTDLWSVGSPPFGVGVGHQPLLSSLI